MDALLKCDSAAREAVALRSEERLAVLVRVHGAAEKVREELEQAGLEVHTTTGPIATGEIPAQRLPQLAELAFVRRVELSRALHAER